MNTTLRSLTVLLVLASSPAWAGKRIQMESTDLQTNKTSAREILVDNDRMKMQVGDTVVMFLTAGGNRLVLLDKGRNEYREMDQASMEAMGRQISSVMTQMEAMLKNLPPAQRAQMEEMMKGKMGGGAPVVEPIVFANRGPGSVNGFRCTKHDGTRKGEKVVEICASALGDVKIAAADFQVMEKMREFSAGMMEAMKSTPLAGMMENTGVTQAGIEGYPVQSITFRNGKPVAREELKAVVEATFTDADFSIGTAKKAEMPNLGSMGR